jgi:arylsulfatase A-like enzyme
MMSFKNKDKEEHKPNFLFILADDLGYNDLSSTGSKYYETPNIDKIGRNGMCFTQGYAAASVSSPSRASILTGKFTARHGITTWIGDPSGEAWRDFGKQWGLKSRHTKLLPAEYKHELSKDFVTLPEALKEGGYKTFFAGKWHLGGKGSGPEDHGFDINIGGYEVGWPPGGYFSPYKNPKMTDGPDGENLTMRLAKETINFMKENKDTAFFAYLSFYAVHAPIQTTNVKWAKYRQKAEDMGIAKTGYKMGKFLPERQVQDNAVYAGLVETLDDAVGEVLKALKDLGLDKNTVVIFTSDNGGVISGDDYSTCNIPLRGGKGYQFEGGIREPYFIDVPWMKLAGKKCNTPVDGTDFYPTILDLAGLKLKLEEHNDGKSLVPLLKGKSIPERPLIWHNPHYGGQGGEPSSIIRLGGWKLIHYYEDGRDELYNLKNDISETSEVSGSNKKKVSQLKELLFTYLKDVGAKYPVKDSEYDPKLEKEYLQGVKDETWPTLEKDRLRILSKDFQLDSYMRNIKLLFN